MGPEEQKNEKKVIVFTVDGRELAGGTLDGITAAGIEKTEKSAVDYELLALERGRRKEKKDPEDPFLYHSRRILELCGAIKRLAEHPDSGKVYLRLSKYAHEIMEIADMVGYIDD